jgi:hypothetical protein
MQPSAASFGPAMQVCCGFDAHATRRCAATDRVAA